MKITLAERQRLTGGFTLIEMIGVLAVIAILAALLIPKVTSAISDARINSTVGSYQTVQTAAAGHYAKYGAFNVTNNSTIGNGSVYTAIPLTNFDTVLIAEGFLDQPFGVKVGTASLLQVVAGGGCYSGAGYKLNGTTVGTSGNAFTVEALIHGVSQQDAYDVASRIDSTLLSATAASTNLVGARCVYTNNVSGLGDMYLYVNGR
jgi:prepilin-type N-terminal cleavage/methylation domain-containing protein